MRDLEDVVGCVALQESVELALELLGRGCSSADGFDLGHRVHGATRVGRLGRSLASADPEVESALALDQAAELSSLRFERRGGLRPFATLCGVGGLGAERRSMVVDVVVESEAGQRVGRSRPDRTVT